MTDNVTFTKRLRAMADTVSEPHLATLLRDAAIAIAQLGGSLAAARRRYRTAEASYGTDDPYGQSIQAQTKRRSFKLVVPDAATPSS